MSSFTPVPIVLQGRHVRLEPLSLAHALELHAAGRDEELWRYMPIAPPRDLEDTRRWIAEALQAAEEGTQIPFAIISLRSRSAAGSTRYLDIQRSNHSLEIGWTWIGREQQRTAINTECKYLLLAHAFETLKAVRVQLKTDARNERAQRAIERLGAVREGVLRRQRRNWDGFIRDTVYYSVIDSEWPGVKSRLEALMDRKGE